jgi:hypothetical protein
MKKQGVRDSRDQPAAARAERLKSALKANLQKRKAQARAKAEQPGDTPDGAGQSKAISGKD